jgi:hypothetical protein
VKLTDKIDALPSREPGDDFNDGSRDWTCTPCGMRCKGAWGHCPTCHLTFPQQAGFDRHRVGKFENQAIGQENTRRCLTGDEMREAGWKYDAEAGIWRTPDPKPKAAS